MENCILVKKLAPPPLNEREILRYAGAKEATDEINELITSCLMECRDAFEYKVCYRVFDTQLCDGRVILGSHSIESKSLCKLLETCPQTVVFGATVGHKIDRLILKNSVTSVSRAHILNAIGTERIEALCDRFCAEFSGASRRFSAGYGDLSIKAQQDIFSLLDLNRKIGVSLGDSLIMSPAKSVTAIFGIGSENADNKCSLCSKRDCDFRR